MARMDAKASLEDISKRCGLSEEIVRRVQRAETEHVIYCLEHGLKANMPGRGTFIPSMRQRLLVGGSFEPYAKAKFTVSSIINNALEEVREFKYLGIEDNDEIPEGVLTIQIEQLQ